MKFYLSFLFFCLISANWGRAQQSNQYFTAAFERGQFAYVALSESNAQVFLAESEDWHHFAIQYVTDTVMLTKTAEDEYSSASWKIVRTKKKEYGLLLTARQPRLNKTYRMQPFLSDRNFDYEVNRAVWTGAVYRLEATLQKQFPQLRLSHLNYWEYTESETLFQENRNLFRNRLAERLKVLSDSLTAIHTGLQQNYLEMQNASSNDDYAVYSQCLVRMYESPYHTDVEYCYHRLICSQLAVTHPEWYFRLMEDYPAIRNTLWEWGVNAGRKQVSELKHTTSHPSLKKQLFRERRRERIKSTLVVTGVCTLEAAIIGGIIYLIVR